MAEWVTAAAAMCSMASVVYWDASRTPNVSPAIVPRNIQIRTSSFTQRSRRSRSAFATVERGEAEGGPRECAVATYPARRFVVAGGLTVVHDGLMEHELLRDEQALALTVLRCTGVLSKPFLPTRPNTAGPPARNNIAWHRLRCAS